MDAINNNLFGKARRDIEHGRGFSCRNDPNISALQNMGWAKERTPLNLMPSMFQNTAPQNAPTLDPAGSFSRSDAAEPANPVDDDLETTEKVQQIANAVSRVRQGMPDGVKTTREAYSISKQLVEEQLDRARLERALPNVAVTGDSSARNAVLMLLSNSQQRTLFMHVSEKREHWGRLRSLFGAPPYHFLHPQDAAMFAASGFARGRVNMAYDDVKSAANTAQFGPGQFVDEDGREYRVSGEMEQSYNDILPGNQYFNVKRGAIYLQVKIRKQSNAKKLALIRSEDRKQILFPRPGEVVTLRESSGFLSARGASESVPTDLRVRALYPRAVGSSTAAVVVSVM